VQNNHPASPNQDRPDESSYLETELRLTLEEIAHLNNALAEANMRLVSLQNQGGVSTSAEAHNKDRLSHVTEEIKPLLTTIESYTDLLANQSVGALGPLQTRFIERISRSLEQVQQILDEYAEQSSSSQMLPHRSENECALTDKIQEVISSKEELLLAKQLILELHLLPSAPNVMGESAEIHAILNAFVENALMITPPLGIVQISLAFDQADHSSLLCFSITDHGPGIPEPQISHLISIQGEQSIPGCILSRSKWLNLNQMILDQGGYLHVENVAGAGCCVKIHFLPVKR
jgi:Signal transduction histidine kinase